MASLFTTLPPEIRTLYDAMSSTPGPKRSHPLYRLTLKTDHTHHYHIYHEHVAQDINGISDREKTLYFRIGLSNTGSLYMHLTTGHIVENVDLHKTHPTYIEIAPSITDLIDSAMLNEHGEFI